MSPIIKQKGERYKLPDRYLLFILTVICLGLIILTLYTDYISRPLGFVAGRVIVPMQSGLSHVGSYLGGRRDELANIRDLLAENERLREQLDILTLENTLYKQDRYELANLRILYELDSMYADYEKVGARIIARDPGNWFHSFTIDKGYEDGLAEDMNILAGAGLIGRIVRVGPNWSRVITIIADNSNVSGQVLATEDNLIVRGNRELYADGVIEFEQLIDNADRVVVGDKIVTSIISDKYLPGILIGYITQISRDANNLTKSGQLAPAVDFERLSEVLVITELKQSIED
ncbi:MAG: rod shape-determining protein MreC [Lachnospiraceae bacterium]|jgi:rod shape-determining protein MreC|nr:rod shape-determining protein MreC [Lachnospiraceae bacterium]